VLFGIVIMLLLSLLLLMLLLMLLLPLPPQSPLPLLLTCYRQPCSHWRDGGAVMRRFRNAASTSRVMCDV